MHYEMDALSEVLPNLYILFLILILIFNKKK